jgi:hypothetical protein
MRFGLYPACIPSKIHVSRCILIIVMKSPRYTYPDFLPIFVVRPRVPCERYDLRYDRRDNRVCPVCIPAPPVLFTRRKEARLDEGCSKQAN